MRYTRLSRGAPVSHHIVTHTRSLVAVDTMRAGFASPQAHIDAIRSFREVLG